MRVAVYEGFFGFVGFVGFVDFVAHNYVSQRRKGAK
jgi:hypothetical protein